MVIVAHGMQRMYEYLRANLAGEQDVAVIVDRRTIDRRGAAAEPVSQERRRRDRRAARHLGADLARDGWAMAWTRREPADSPGPSDATP
ncbi:MAG: hypothetical protein HYR86_01355 [Candidatus Rokubacteria bacterium]|nr:hypothetical protein [Candidatus Rokubacteria bacterium]